MSLPSGSNYRQAPFFNHYGRAKHIEQPNPLRLRVVFYPRTLILFC